jgi:hypothetical protein
MIRFGNIPTCQQNERWEGGRKKITNRERERERK